MKDRELEELRQRQLQEMQAQAEQQLAQEQELIAHKAQVQGALRQLMSAEAKERLAQVRIARPGVAAAVEQQVLALAGDGKLTGPIDDATLQQMLAHLSRKRETKVEIRGYRDV
ncbi:MAG: DNA-binding protein [Candidatus Poseidoniia archaeon]|jgi:programmed cell death protein 5|nr:DNA-binding protein [Candidatus Poseidoniia archaeon]MDP7136243.1 DNA-binding protein [Candidatus Poseidoniia archaeon]MDP7243085.1 DNA-binding protein [Candidatus Poseidoniia archaeon]MDP7535585.1 DNA-binding protein [Candidatus Poseidoniia archaeon]MDP7590335.1 DNA-binding protein [Candidatus Poseidoniia archaeon]|tara:strand:+ start:1019 stop:1360 length:342 start_codon:yes stop_codon:yes gene_type:complete